MTSLSNFDRITKQRVIRLVHHYQDYGVDSISKTILFKGIDVICVKLCKYITIICIDGANSQKPEKLHGSYTNVKGSQHKKVGGF